MTTAKDALSYSPESPTTETLEPESTRTIIRVTTLGEMVTGCPAKVPHILAGETFPTHWVAARGTAVHAAMQHALLLRRDGLVPTLRSTVAAYLTAWNEAAPTVTDWTPNEECPDKDAMRESGVNRLKVLGVNTRHIDPLYVEETWYWDVPGTNYRLQGTLDCVEWQAPKTDEAKGQTFIHDWKNTNYVRGQKWADSQFQPTGYLVLHEANRRPFQMTPKAFVLWSVGWSSEDGEIAVGPRIVKYGADAVQKATEIVIDAVRRLEAGTTPRKTPGGVCDYCPLSPTGC